MRIAPHAPRRAGTVLDGEPPADKVATQVLSRPEPPARRLLVPADDPALRQRVRAHCAELEAVLTHIDPGVVLPLLDHGVDEAGRPYLVVAEPAQVTGAPDVGAAATALARGLGQLRHHGLVGAVPPLYRTASGYVLGTPLPPDLAPSGPDDPPEVRAGGAWTPAAQVYASAARLAGLVRRDSPVHPVLTAALNPDPAARPADLAALAQQVHSALSDVESTDPLARAGGEGEARPLGSRYLLDAPIGRGATGVVWAGRRREDDAPVAVKLLRPELAEDPEVVNRFLRERAILVRLRHPHLVGVQDLVAEGEVLGLVMDLVAGEDLRRRLARGPLALADAAALLAQVADGLAAVHAAGLVHRDVKPENILVTERDGATVALLSDFGIARAVEGSAHTEMIGTPAYVAPELVAGRAPDPAVDVYALGVTAYELLTGAKPFSAPTTAALLRAHLDQPVPRPEGIAREAWHLLADCLGKQPGSRPRAAEVAFRWSRLADPSSVEAGPAVGAAPSAAGPVPADPSTWDTERSARPLAVAPDPPVVGWWRRWRRRLVALAAVAVVGIGAGVALAVTRAGRGGSNPSPASTGAQPYLLPATIRLNGATATLAWARPGPLPGLVGYVVLDEQGRPVSTETLPADVTTFLVHDIAPGRRACFVVLAVGVTVPAPDPPAQPACVTPSPPVPTP